ncbi:hypothetical protein F4820DRAFT_454220 [Hypoxylon rubiginosum]|uniref:Uncharacterized protein n=1 Tax=Hypoxylon rubiginosum TaxID=110542 RepID=A0ACB9YI66_9PEZI|nr:hypothetical protein F4820DRAFT_454220 [Hypoxylon rubiginosum]
MVKMVNSQAAKLAEARNTIEELKKENAALRLENKLLRASRSASAPITPKRWPTISPNVCKPVCSEKTYDRPTRASTIRAAEARRETRPAEKVKRAEAHFGDETYVYVDGHPIRSTGLQIPRFMFGTQSSNAKREWCCVRARFLVHPTTHINDDSDSQEGCDTTPLDDTTLSGGTTASEDNVIIPQVPVLRTSQELHSVLEDSISVDRLFPGRIVRIRGDTGFKILQTAHRIAQEALYDAARKFWPRMWEQVKEGPHVVRLGRLELAQYVGEHGTRVDLSLCGCTTHAVHNALLELVHLRNRICHPEGDSFQPVGIVDVHLEHVQRLLIALGDDDRATHDAECGLLAEGSIEEKDVVGIVVEAGLACEARNIASADIRRSAREILDRDNEADLGNEADVDLGRF